MPILPNCIKRPAVPVARDYRPVGGTKHKVRDGDSCGKVISRKNALYHKSL